MTRDEMWFDSGKISERAYLVAMLESKLDDAAKVGIFYKEGFEKAIAIIKGENKHTHEIEVFGAPCLGGDYHEYCLKCGWVEPCEIDGENK